MTILFDKAKESRKIIISSRELDKKYKLIEAEKTYMNVKMLLKESPAENKPKLHHLPTKYIIMGRIITPLLLANERIVEKSTIEKDKEPVNEIKKEICIGNCNVQEKMQQMSICEENEDYKEEKKQGNSVKLKRGYSEMNKLDSTEIDIFPMPVLKAILAYMDYQMLRQNIKIQSTSIGHFSVVILEVLYWNVQYLYRLMPQNLRTFIITLIWRCLMTTSI
jgi:hypothetical protein